MLESCKIVFLGGISYSLVRHFCYRMYRLATVHFVTDRRTHRRQYYANADHSAWQYDWLETTALFLRKMLLKGPHFSLIVSYNLVCNRSEHSVIKTFHFSLSAL